MPIRNQLKITRIISATGDVAMQLQSLHFSNFRPIAAEWQPAMNAYFRKDSICLCFDLAGVNRREIDIIAEPNRVVIRGSRAIPCPGGDPVAECEKLFVMEIENGAFVRVVDLPHPIDPNQTTARQENGFLWLHLPLTRDCP